MRIAPRGEKGVKDDFLLTPSAGWHHKPGQGNGMTMVQPLPQGLGSLNTLALGTSSAGGSCSSEHPTGSGPTATVIWRVQGLVGATGQDGVREESPSRQGR